MKLARIAIAALVVSLPWASAAQDFLPAGDGVHERIFEIQPFAGWFLPDDNAGYDTGSPWFGARGVLNNTSRWAFEAQAGLVFAQNQLAPQGMVVSYEAHPVFNNSGSPVGVVITELETSERVVEHAASLLMVSGSALVHLSKERTRPFVSLGGGFLDDMTSSGDPPGAFSNMFFEAGVGLKTLRPSGWGLRLELKDVMVRKNDVPRASPDAALIAAQADALTGGGADGVLFQEPYTPVEYRGKRWLHNIGLSVGLTIPFGWAWKDGDGDGVETRFDKCPTTAPNVVVDLTGCGTDTDKDGVFDGVDTCPETPLGATVDRTGCPGDSDGDGVWDGIDVANDTPPGALVDATGQHHDADGDGVFDGVDKCEETPRGAGVDGRGCPVDPVEDALLRKLPVVVAAEFEAGTSELDPRSYRSINRVARLVERWTSNKERPLRIEIGVHGGAGEETSLSQRRAEAVRTYLLDNFYGVVEANLVAKGYPSGSADNAPRAEILYIGEGEVPVDLLSDESPIDVPSEPVAPEVPEAPEPETPVVPDE